MIYVSESKPLFISKCNCLYILTYPCDELFVFDIVVLFSSLFVPLYVCTFVLLVKKGNKLLKNVQVNNQ